jgi:Methyltransferase domain
VWRSVPDGRDECPEAQTRPDKKDAVPRFVELVRSERPTAVVEFGSGTSTVVLAALLAELHRDGPRVVCSEQDRNWIGHTRDALVQRGLERMLAFAYLPLGEHGDGTPPCYVLTDEAAELLRRHSPETVLVDGPTLDSGASRFGTVDLVAPFLRRDVTLLLDDALYDAGLLEGQAWERRDEIVIHGIRPTARGLLEATLRVGRADRSTTDLSKDSK